MTEGLSLTAIFSVLAGYFFGNFRDEASINTLGYAVRLHDTEWLCRNKFCFCYGISSSDHSTFKNNCVKPNNDRLILSVAHIFSRDSSFDNIRYSCGFS